MSTHWKIGWAPFKMSCWKKTLDVFKHICEIFNVWLAEETLYTVSAAACPVSCSGVSIHPLRGFTL